MQTTTLILPICNSVTDGKQTSLIIHIPASLCPLAPHGYRLSRTFVPYPEYGLDTYSESITTYTYPKLKIPAIELITAIKDGIVGRETNVRIASCDSSSHEGYDTAILTIVYQHKDVQELMHARYFSGPHDCSGIRYHIRLNDISETDARIKIETFFRDHVAIRAIMAEDILTKGSRHDH